MQYFFIVFSIKNFTIKRHPLLATLHRQKVFRTWKRYQIHSNNAFIFSYVYMILIISYIDISRCVEAPRCNFNTSELETFTDGRNKLNPRRNEGKSLKIYKQKHLQGDAYVLGQGFWLFSRYLVHLESNFFYYEMKPI